MIAAAFFLILAGAQAQPQTQTQTMPPAQGMPPAQAQPPVSMQPPMQPPAPPQANDPVAPFVLVAQAEDMLSRCAQLDRAASRGTRVRRARAAVADLSTRSSAAGRGDLLSRGWQRWTAMRDGVDTSCTVGPGETNSTAYAALIGDLERTVREAAAMLPAGRGRR